MRNCSQVIILCGVFTWQIVDITIIDIKIFIGAALMFAIVAIFLFSSTTSCTSLADNRFKIESAQSMSILDQNRRHCSGWVWSGATPRYWKPRVILQGFHIFCVALWRRNRKYPSEFAAVLKHTAIPQNLSCWEPQRIRSVWRTTLWYWVVSVNIGTVRLPHFADRSTFFATLL